jgi:hypothetical protein
MPPRPKDGPGGPWKQQRLSTGLEYPARASEAVELAETLGRGLERDRTGIAQDQKRAGGHGRCQFAPLPSSVS